MTTTMRSLLHELMEENQAATTMGYCPWCDEPEYPVNKNNQPIEAGDDVAEYHIDHSDHCGTLWIAHQAAIAKAGAR